MISWKFCLLSFLDCNIAVQTVKPGCTEEDCPITMFYENKLFPSLFGNEPIKFINLRHVSRKVKYVQTLLKFSMVAELNLECYRFVCKKIYIHTGILRILCFQKTFWFGQSLSKCPSSTVHTVMCSGELFPKWCMLATLVTRSFYTTTLKFWNSPPVHICDIQSLAAFKRLVKTFF